MALKYTAGAMPSTPYTALNYLTGTHHITDYLQGEAAKGAVRLMGQGDWTLEPVPAAKVLSRLTAPYRTTSFMPLTLKNMTDGILPNLNSSSTTATLSPTQQPLSQRTTKTDSTLTS